MPHAAKKKAGGYSPVRQARVWYLPPNHLKPYAFCSPILFPLFVQWQNRLAASLPGTKAVCVVVVQENDDVGQELPMPRIFFIAVKLFY